MVGIAVSYPSEFMVSAGGKPVRYVLADELVAIRNAPAGSQVVATLDDGEISVFRAIKPVAAAEVVAVYRLGSSGPLAVPTGKVFLRFRENDALTEHRPEIEGAGFLIESVLSYAPQAGWVVPASGAIPDALVNYRRLAEISGVEGVEPQMLSPAEHRG